jgi:S-DNA-T family DNA segregation ATPase FtsK/SpoIIIE
MAIGSMLDSARGARRDRRAAEHRLDEACDRVRAEVARRHGEERELRRAATPDVRGAATHDGWLWRRQGPLAVGYGTAASIVAVTGGEGEGAERLRADAGTLDAAPVTVAWEQGVCVRGDGAAGRAVVRALVAQLVLRHPPTAVSLAGRPLGEDWADGIPHLRSAGPDARIVAVIAPGEAVPEGAETVIALVGEREGVPHECAALVELDEGLRGRLVADGGDVRVETEAISIGQARRIGATMTGRARRTQTMLPGGPVPFAHVCERAGNEHDAERRPAGLRAAIGLGLHSSDETAPLVEVDLVSDGPHAVVVGTTGAGKSELLTTWIAALAAAHSPAELVFLLGDFKGGTAFDHLRGLPHVTGVLTDLDGAGARRAVEGLRAEIHRRERLIAGAGARDIADPRVGLARLVIVIDEFAALLQDHPDLHQTFTDIAARGRALGMHLVLGTQRASGILRDALLANSPLRVALRVSEERESTQLIGATSAADIPGDAAHRGVGYVRRAGDAGPEPARFALVSASDVSVLEHAHENAPPARGPLLDPLPAEWRPAAAVDAAGALVCGLADEPEAQRQTSVTLAPGTDRGLLVIGGAGSGKTSFARWVADAGAAGGYRVVHVPRDSEGAWDALERAEQDPPELFVIDDADALIARFPSEYGQAAGEKLEQIVRDAGVTGTTVVLTVARMTGAISKIADVLPRRVVLALPAVHDHTAAGADRELYDPRRGPGRAVIDGHEAQLAMPEARREAEDDPDPERWRPSAPLTGLIVRAANRRAEALRAAWGPGVRVVPVDELPPGALPDSDGTPLAIVGDADAWQRQYAALQAVRASGDMVVGSDCATELRTMLGERELPPYARPRAARAWLVAGGAPPRRVILP